MSIHCDDVRDALPLFAYADLEPREMGRLGIHIGSCPACRAEHAQLRQLLGLTDEFTVSARPVDVAAVLARSGHATGSQRHASAVLGKGLIIVGLAAVLGIVALVLEMREMPVPPVPTRPDSPSPVADPPDEPAPIEAEAPRPAAVAEERAQPRREPLPPPDMAAARQLLAMSAAGDPTAEAASMRTRLSATGVEVDGFLVESVRSAEPAAARAALAMLAATRPGLALDAAALALTTPGRDELHAQATQLLARESLRAATLLESAWGRTPDGTIARAFASHRSARAARGLAARISARQREGLPWEPALWESFASLGELAAEPAARLLPELPAAQQAAALAVAARQQSRITRRAILALLPDDAGGLGAAVTLAGWGDASGLDLLLAAAASPSAEFAGPAGRARAALVSLAARNPGALTSRLSRLQPEGEETLRCTVAALREGAPSHLWRALAGLASNRDTAELAIAVASHAKSADAARALLPLGRSRTSAGRAVAIAAELGLAGVPILIDYLGSRYGSKPARAALEALQGQNVGDDAVNSSAN